MRAWMLIFILLGPASAFAQGVCAKVDILAAAPEERCEIISEAAVECFRLLDQKVAGAERARRSGKMGAGAIQGLLDNLQAGVQSAESYLNHLKKEDPPCLNQEGEVEVILEELQKDLRRAEGWAKKTK